jgi:hypothetical protein
MSALDEHAQAIGHVCIQWGQMELLIDMLLAALLFAHPPGHPPTTGKMRLAACISANSDIRAKIQMALAVGYLRRPNDKWFLKLEKCLNRIDSQLRERRNRIIHDLWMVSQSIPGGAQEIIRKRTQGTKITKPQAFQRILEQPKTETIKAKEIWQLRDDISDASTMVAVLWGNFLHPGFLPWP